MHHAYFLETTENKKLQDNECHFDSLLQKRTLLFRNNNHLINVCTAERLNPFIQQKKSEMRSQRNMFRKIHIFFSQYNIVHNYTPSIMITQVTIHSEDTIITRVSWFTQSLGFLVLICVQLKKEYSYMVGAFSPLKELWSAKEGLHHFNMKYFQPILFLSLAFDKRWVFQTMYCFSSGTGPHFTKGCD